MEDIINTSSQPHYNTTILIADNAKEHISLLMDILEPENYKIVCTANGEQTIKMALKIHPDIILINLNSESINGVETCRQLKQSELTQKIPLIFMIDKRDQHNISTGFDVGGADYITTPLYAEEVKARISTHIALHRRQTCLYYLMQPSDSSPFAQANQTLTASDCPLGHNISTPKESTELAHMTDMSKIATDIIHNIGNILTGMSGHCNAMHSSLKESQLIGLSKANQLLQQHSDSLDVFLNEDPRGKQLPLYYQSLDEILKQEHNDLLDNAIQLKKLILVMTEVINTQQTYANNHCNRESLQAESLIENSLQLFHCSLSKHHIQITRKFEPVKNIKIQSTKFLQILINLFKNAKEAMLDMGTDHKMQMLITISSQQPEWVMIRISDNGIGISAQNLTKIFVYGFTTKKTGHGFGLHYCENALTEMGGKLSVESDGEGKGTTFTLLCPTA